MPAMNDVVLSIGSNFGKRAESVGEALEWLSSLLFDVCASGIYETPDFTGKSTFYFNSVLQGRTDLDFDSLNTVLKDYECLKGRNAEMRRKNLVPIDIDIVVWNSEFVRPRDFSHDFFKIGYLQLKERALKNQYFEAR